MMKRVSTVIVKRRLVTVFLFGMLVFGIIILRLGYVQFVSGKELSNLADESWSRDILFEPERGRIVDKNGVIMGENITAPSIVIIPRQVKNKQETAKNLAHILQISETRALEYVTKKSSTVDIRPEGKKISKEQEEAIRSLNMPGIYLAKDSKRHYPFGHHLAHVLGFTGIDNQGLMGLELYHDELLKGKKGRLSYYSDAKGGKIEKHADVYQPPTDGLDLKTTIDSRIQEIMERELDLAEAKYNPDGAIAIAVNPNDGSVLGMASRPTFHPEAYQQVDPEVYGRNLPIWMTFEPGSTFKIITLAASLEENLIDLNKDTYHDQGFVKVGGSRLRCWKSGGHGSQTFLEVVENSCNPGFVHLGQLLGPDKLFSYINKFGFGSKTGIDLQGEGTGILFKRENIGPVELATTSFGQGVSVTPIQQVMAVSAAINGGYLYEPYVAKAWLDPQTGKEVKTYKPVLKERVISDKTSKEVRQALESVVANGTGRPAYVDGYRVGGKTGTAQKVGRDGRYMANNHIVSFIGFAPSDNPEIVVYVAIDNPKGTVQFGGVVAAPIVGQIIEDSLSILGVERRKDGLEKKTQWPDIPKVKVPDFRGKRLDELVTDLTNLALEVEGEGEIILDQSPEAGVMVEQGSTIRLYVSDK